MSPQPLMIKLVTRLIFAIVVLSLVPLAGVSLSALAGYQAASQQAVATTATVLDDTSLGALQVRTEQAARELSRFMIARAADARTAALLPRNATSYARFAASHTGELWYPAGPRDQPVERREQQPLFREIIAIDGQGRLIAQIVDGLPQSGSPEPARLNHYLTTARSLAPGQIDVSRLHRRYSPRPNDVATRPDGADYANFDGVIRFTVPLEEPDGHFGGALMLALDARHVIDHVIHILPTHNERWTVWPNYDSGNYAYLLDDEGWTIGHPRLWTVRGDDEQGQPVAAVTEQMTREERNRHPFNARLGGWADPNLPVLFDNARAGRAGFVITVNQTGTRKATTYAPILFQEGSYRQTGVFGVLAIGANMEEFHRASTTVATAIEAEQARLQFQLIGIAAIALVLLGLVATAISRTLTRPLVQLTNAARQLKRGELDESTLEALQQRRFADEVTTLAVVFRDMATQVIRRERQLKTEIAQLTIQIDHQKRSQQVAEITETDYFRTLRENAHRLRTRAREQSGPEGKIA